MTLIVLLDNTVLSNFGLVNRPDVLFALWGAVLGTTQAVIDEYQAGAANHALPADCWQTLPIVEPTAAEIALGEKLSRTLGAGERTCLAVAITRRGWIATDDQKARAIAEQYGVGVTGTLGILREALKHELLTLPEANALLHQMLAAGYRSPIADLNEL